MILRKVVAPLVIATASLSASAAEIFVDVAPIQGAGPAFDAPFPGFGLGDDNTTTAIFRELGFTGTRATSFYDLSNGSIIGDFFDTNIPTELLDAGFPVGGFPEGTTTLNGTPLGNPSNGEDDSYIFPREDAETDINALNPIALTGEDSEGYLASWYFDTEFFLEGTLSASGPSYTGGFIEIFFVDQRSGPGSAVRTSVLTAQVSGSDIEAANLNIFFDITSVTQGLFFVRQADGDFTDVANVVDLYGAAPIVLDTNVNPPIPAEDQLVLTTDVDGNTFAVRQALLDGSVNFLAVPEPGTLAVMGLGLLGFGFAGRRKRH